MYRYLVASLMALGLVFGSAPSPASADHIKGFFPDQGFLFMSAISPSGPYSGNLYVSSNHCGAWEQAAWDAVVASTRGQSYMGSGRWPYGLKMYTQRCDGLQDNSIEIQLFYKDQSNFLQPDGRYIGGRNQNFLRSTSYCSYWGKSHPCGTFAQVELNNQKFFGASDTYRKRELMHETGHSNNFAGSPHHCNSESINNDGGSSCFGGTFLSTTGYKETDRIGINRTYVR